VALANPSNLSVRVIKKAIVEVSGVEKGQHYGIKNNGTKRNATTRGGATPPQEEEQYHHGRKMSIVSTT
jgi:hypothetical protein